VNVEAKSSGSTSGSGAQEWIRVEDADVDGLELVLTTGLEVRGRFRVDGDLPESFTGWQVTLSPHGPMPMRNGPVNRQGEVAPDGSVLFQGLPPVSTPSAHAAPTAIVI
jgi:hypothetical protein